ncbi:sterol desaturase family protein [Candidatus Thiothrix anitrata]|uniref:Sterol desaturase family protein n=2 Tax=Candidatus Thiothrix anitrata TaxID=2823902 RepID=A0ABX7X946_9GAMM|nr:sterol desaturase family protein [Candidatus Thiothrix anitrata]QTR51753.1 sterol desaturase family protein [Candidatus Thiothrix anitrata]
MQQEPVIRMAMMLGVLAIMATWEWVAPRRALSVNKAYRWSNNFGVIALGTLLTRLVVPAGAVGLAVFVESQGWGLLQVVNLPLWLTVLIAIVVLDFTIWAQHVMFHAIPTLWRLHRMHHADLDIDVTTGLRFHPLEILLSFGIKATVIVALGVPAVAVLLFEIILSSLAMFNHSNVRMPLAVDRVLRLLIVTPDFHRVHHSWYPHETNSNFGFNLSIWDRMMGTYRAQPDDGHDGMTIGINQFRDPKWERLDKMLIQPFVGPTNSYPLNQRGEANLAQTPATPTATPEQ